MQNSNNYIFYDLETNGLDHYTTGIMQMSMIDINGDILLNQYTYPFDNRIDGTEIHGIDEQKLINNNAIQTVELLLSIKKIIKKAYNNEKIFLIAYNNFGYDQLILENNFKICDIKMPNNWYFIDLFPIIKEIYPAKNPNFKLKTVFENICGSDSSINFHCSLGDTTCLYKIYNKILDRIEIFPKYTRASFYSNEINISPITSLNGYHKSFNFEMKNIYTIGDIYNIFKQCKFDNEIFDLYLRDNLGIYSNYFMKDIKKQLTFIKYIND